MVNSKKDKKKIIKKSHENLTISQSTHLLDKNSKTIIKLCQLIEIKRIGKEKDINYDKEGYITKRIEKLKIRINKRLAKLAKWVDMPDHEQLAMMPNKVHQTRSTPLLNNSNNLNVNNNQISSNLLSKSRSKSITVNKPITGQQIRQLLPQHNPPRYPNYPQLPHPPQPQYLQPRGPLTIPGQNYNRNLPIANYQLNRPNLPLAARSVMPPGLPIPKGMIPPRSGLTGNQPFPYPRTLIPNGGGDQKGWGLTPSPTSHLSSLMHLQKQMVQTTSTALKSSMPNNSPQTLQQSPQARIPPQPLLNPNSTSSTSNSTSQN